MRKLALQIVLFLPFLILSFTNHQTIEPGDIKISIVGEDVKVEWTGFSGVSNYILEVATNADQSVQLVFDKLAKIENNSHDLNYSFVDNSKDKSGIRYYRIKYVQTDTKYRLSEVKTANFLFKDNFTLNISPDYVKQSIYLEVNSKSDGEATIKVSEMNSNVIVEEKLTVKKGLTKQEIKVPAKLNEGIVLFSFSYNGNTQHVMLRKNPVQNFMVISED